MKYNLVILAAACLAWQSKADDQKQVVDLLAGMSQPYMLASDGNSTIYYGALRRYMVNGNLTINEVSEPLQTLVGNLPF